METIVACFLVEYQIYLNMVDNKGYNMEEGFNVWL